MWERSPDLDNQLMEQVIIIGAGPAGISTAIQLKRYAIEPVILEKNRIGGLLINANLVENYPGFPDGISGIELVKLFETQLKKLSIKVIFEEVLNLDYQNDVFVVQTNKRIFNSRIVVVASGTKPKQFTEIEIPEGARDKILYEISSIHNVKEKKIIIIGAGDAAFDYALNLARRNEVFILNKGEKTKCLPLLNERVEKSPRVTYSKNTIISEIKNHNRGLIIKLCGKGLQTLINRHQEMPPTLHAHYLIFAIGREPQLDYLSGFDKSNPYIYFIGDVKNGMYRQTAIAVGDGIYTGMKIYKKLNP